MLHPFWATVAGLFSLLISLPAFPQDRARTPLEDHLVTTYQGKKLMVQGCYCGKELNYDSKGTLLDGGQPGSWTTCRDLRIDNVQISEHKLQIIGMRVQLFYDPEKREFRDVDEIEDHAADKYKQMIEAQRVKIEVALPSQADQNSTDAVLGEIFWPGDFNFSQAAPEIWKGFFPGQADPSSPKKCDGPPPSMPRGEIIETTNLAAPAPNSPRSIGKAVPPRVIHAPDPEFSDAARKAKYQGVTALKVMIGVDGRVHSFQIVRPLGMGLDEKAIESIKQWRFEPARKSDGTPVDVYAVIEINFKLF